MKTRKCRWGGDGGREMNVLVDVAAQDSIAAISQHPLRAAPLTARTTYGWESTVLRDDDEGSISQVIGFDGEWALKSASRRRGPPSPVAGPNAVCRSGGVAVEVDAIDSSEGGYDGGLSKRGGGEGSETGAAPLDKSVARFDTVDDRSCRVFSIRSTRSSSKCFGCEGVSKTQDAPFPFPLHRTHGGAPSLTHLFLPLRQLTQARAPLLVLAAAGPPAAFDSTPGDPSAEDMRRRDRGVT